MAFLKRGVSPLRHREDTPITTDSDTYLGQLSAAAQQAELNGDRTLAATVHTEINQELDSRRS